MQNLGNIGVMGLVCSGKTLASGQTAENKRPRFSASRGWGQNLGNIEVSAIPLYSFGPRTGECIGWAQRVSVRETGPLPGCQRSKIILQITSAFLCYRK